MPHSSFLVIYMELFKVMAQLTLQAMGDTLCNIISEFLKEMSIKYVDYSPVFS